MKIIKKGTVDGAIKRFECKGCGCVFEANKREYCDSSWREVMLCVLPNYKCACPICGNMVYAD